MTLSFPNDRYNNVRPGAGDAPAPRALRGAKRHHGTARTSPAERLHARLTDTRLAPASWEAQTVPDTLGKDLRLQGQERSPNDPKSVVTTLLSKSRSGRKPAEWAASCRCDRPPCKEENDLWPVRRHGLHRRPPQTAPPPQPADPPRRTGPALRRSERPPSFDDLFAQLPAPSDSRWRLDALASAAWRHLPGLPRSRKDLYNAFSYDARGETRSWLNTHVWHGMMSRGRGAHYRDIRLAYKERDAYWRALRNPFSGTVVKPGEVEEFANATESISADMLDTIEKLERRLAVDAENRSNAGTWRKLKYRLHDFRNRYRSDVLLKIYEQHRHIFWIVAKPEDEATTLTSVAERLHGLLKKGFHVTKRSSDVSALVAQLIQDQAQIAKIAGIIRRANEAKEEAIEGVRGVRKEGDGSRIQNPEQIAGTIRRADEAKREAIKGVQKERKESHIQTLRKTGFASLRHADHFLRTFDFLMHGLADPQHKLNRALSAGGIVGNEKTVESYKAILSGMAVGDELKLDGGWDRGLNFLWLFIAYPPALADAYFGGITSFSPSEAYRYSLKLEKLADGVKISMGRTGTTRAALGSSVWGGAEAVNGWLPDGSFGVVGRAEWSESDLLGIKIKGGDDATLDAILDGLLSGGLEDPYALLKQADGFDADHHSLNVQQLGISAGFWFYRSLVDRFGADPRESGGWGSQHQTFLIPLSGRVDVKLLAQQSGQGYRYASDTNAYSDVTRSKASVPLATTLSAGPMAIPRIRIDEEALEGTSAFPRGGYTGPILTGRVGATLQYSLYDPERAQDRSLAASMVPESYSVTTDEQGKLKKVAWNLTLHRTGKILELPAIKPLLDPVHDSKSMYPSESVTLHSDLVNLLSFTTPKNRLEIGEKLDKLDSLARKKPRLAAKIEALRAFTEFTQHSDRKRFRKGVGKIISTLAWEVRRGRKEDDNDRKLRSIAKSLLTENMAPDLWRPKNRDNEVMIALELAPEQIAALNEAGADGAAIAEAVKNPEMPRITGISANETRDYTTSASWPIIFSFGSSAGLTLTRKLAKLTLSYSEGRPSYNKLDTTGSLFNDRSRRLNVTAPLAPTATNSVRPEEATGRENAGTVSTSTASIGACSQTPLANT